MKLRTSSLLDSRTLRILAHFAGMPRLEVEVDPGIADGDATLSHAGGVVTGDLWRLAEHLCQGSAAELLRQPELQHQWCCGAGMGGGDRTTALHPSHVEQLLSTDRGDGEGAFLCGWEVRLVDLWASVMISTQEWKSNRDDSQYPCTVNWIQRIQEIFSYWIPVQNDIYLEIAGATDAPRSMDRERATQASRLPASAIFRYEAQSTTV